jgi:hypothetical protein
MAITANAFNRVHGKPLRSANHYLATPFSHLRYRFSAALEEATRKFAAFILDWTPFLLVASYFIFSTCIYMVCTEKLIGIFWFIYLMTNFYIAGGTALEAFMSIEPCREARKAVVKAEENNWVFATPDDELMVLDLLIVAYLPNEKDIILDRIL